MISSKDSIITPISAVVHGGARMLKPDTVNHQLFIKRLQLIEEIHCLTEKIEQLRPLGSEMVPEDMITRLEKKLIQLASLQKSIRRIK